MKSLLVCKGAIKGFFLSLIACMLLFPTTGQAKVYKVEDVPVVHLQDATKYVSNPESILSSETVEAIDSMFYALEQSTGIEVMVVALTDFEGGDCFQFAYDLGTKNGVGKKGADNGLVVLLSTEQRCIQFVTGYGLEDTLPDAICKRIQEEYMTPYFSDDEWDKGMLEGMKAVYGHLNGSMEIVEEEESWLDILLYFLKWVGGVYACAWLLVRLGDLWDRRPRECPQCHKRSFWRKSHEKVYEDKVVSDDEYEDCYHSRYVCSKCGFSEEYDEISTHSRGSSGGSGSFGGSGGGSYGGGSFGGGGSGSRF